MTDDTILSLWAAEVDRLAESTRTEYRRYLDHLARDLDVSLREATTLDLKAWPAERDWAPPTRAYAIRALKSLYRWMAAEQLCDDVAAPLKLPPVTEPPVRVADDVIHRALMAAAQSKRVSVAATIRNKGHAGWHGGVVA